MEGRLWFFLLTVLNYALAEDKPLYIAFGETLVMKPNLSEPIKTILWKHEGNLVAEWDNGSQDFFGAFGGGRTSLNSTTGEVKITKMTFAQSGLYTTEINSRVQIKQFKIEVIKKVPKPEMVVKPLVCSDTFRSCNLSCDGATEEHEPVTYAWQEDNGEWIEGVKDKIIEKEGTQKIKTFSCRLKNPVSERVSDIFNNPFYYEVPVGIIIAVVLGVFVLLAAGIGGYLKQESIRKCLNIGANDTDRTKGPACTAETKELKEGKSNDSDL